MLTVWSVSNTLITYLLDQHTGGRFCSIVFLYVFLSTIISHYTRQVYRFTRHVVVDIKSFPTPGEQKKNCSIQKRVRATSQIATFCNYINFNQCKILTGACVNTTLKHTLRTYPDWIIIQIRDNQRVFQGQGNVHILMFLYLFVQYQYLSNVCVRQN